MNKCCRTVSEGKKPIGADFDLPSDAIVLRREALTKDHSLSRTLYISVVQAGAKDRCGVSGASFRRRRQSLDFKLRVSSFLGYFSSFKELPSYRASKCNWSDVPEWLKQLERPDNGQERPKRRLRARGNCEKWEMSE